LSDYVVDGRSARIVPAEDSGRLREVIQETFEDQSLREALGEAALKTVKETNTTRHMSERVAAVIRSCVPAGVATRQVP
jgi:hypothetical protein